MRAQSAGVIAAQQAAEEARKVVQAQILAQLLAQYAQPEMSKAINVIMRWYRDLPAGQLTPTIMELQSYQGIWPSEFEELDNSRRYVAGYFQSVYNLWQQTHLLDDKTASGALDVVRLKIYLQYIEP